MDEVKGTSMPDPALAARFTKLLDGYQTSLLAFAFGVVSERELARDVVQETFVAAWRTAAHQAAPFCDPFDEEGMRRWLFAVTYRQAALALRRQRRFAWQSLDHHGPDEALEATRDIAERAAEADALRSALGTLNPVDAACFLLQAVHGFSTEEIAAVVQVRSGTVRKRLSRARQRLRAAYVLQGTNATTTTEEHQGRQAHE
jgi:RNA polymerase sigma-70 factor (ECF subfamily)